MHIGVVLPQVGADWDLCLASARHAEEHGADSVWVIDHVLGFPPARGILEAWSLMSALAATTDRVQIGAQVLCQSFRNPAMLAKIAATTDRISGGRLRMLVGAGWFQQEYEQFGWEFPSPGVRIEQLRDTVHILKGLLGPHEAFTYEGKHYSVRDAVNMPLPVQQPLPIELGGGGDRLLRTVATLADGWNCPGAALGYLDNRLEFLKSACDKAGRDPSDLRLSCQIVCAVGDEEAAQHPGLAMFNPPLGLVGTVDQATARARELIDKGVTDFNCVIPPGSKGRACLERLLNEVRPALG
ncbi:MAG TPA: LLM class flavin-dependent oxidoreductase [Actinomycetota bacterium]|jgi:alkanesulfonate monooxygenase SsuD/methylene tetrahydromethanopterin reductase-like flavin-dependent oxidoreductase (luciferase family)|nr:LLM class flavin-dependent oxidoreductase [Actinomycetota bacterium]